MKFFINYMFYAQADRNESKVEKLVFTIGSVNYFPGLFDDVWYNYHKKR